MALIQLLIQTGIVVQVFPEICHLNQQFNWSQWIKITAKFECTKLECTSFLSFPNRSIAYLSK